MAPDTLVKMVEPYILAVSESDGTARPNELCHILWARPSATSDPVAPPSGQDGARISTRHISLRLRIFQILGRYGCMKQRLKDLKGARRAKYITLYPGLRRTPKAVWQSVTDLLFMR